MTPRLPVLLAALLALAASLPAALAQEEGAGQEDPAEAEDTSREEDDEIEDEVAPEEGPDDEREGDGKEEDAGDDDQEDDEWEEERRELSFRHDEAGFEYESRRRSALAQDEIRASYEIGDATFRFEYESEEPTQTQLSFLVRFVALGEHEDTNGNGAYDVGEPVHQRIDIQRLPSPSLARQEQPTHTTATTTYALPGSGTFALRFHIATQSTTIGGVALNPTETKYDVVVNDFPWTSNSSRLFLETRAHTLIDAELDEDDRAPGLEFANGTIQGYYRWLNTTSVDGLTEPVGASVLSSKTTLDEDEATHESIVVFSYAHGTRIVHDPSIGVAKVVEVVRELVEQVKGDWRIWTAAAAVATVTIFATAIPRSRRP